MPGTVRNCSIRARMPGTELNGLSGCASGSIRARMPGTVRARMPGTVRARMPGTVRARSVCEIKYIILKIGLCTVCARSVCDRIVHDRQYP